MERNTSNKTETGTLVDGIAIRWEDQVVVAIPALLGAAACNPHVDFSFITTAMDPDIANFIAKLFLFGAGTCAVLSLLVLLVKCWKYLARLPVLMVVIVLNAIYFLRPEVVQTVHQHVIVGLGSTVEDWIITVLVLLNMGYLVFFMMILVAVTGAVIGARLFNPMP